jgi:hypothetical protein
MSEQRAVEFVGAPRPGTVSNQYLPQTGQHVGRRLLRVEDIPDDHWRDGASLAGTAWPELLGLVKSGDGLWEVRRPESLGSGNSVVRGAVESPGPTQPGKPS